MARSGNTENTCFPNNQLLLICCALCMLQADKTVRVWDMKTGECLKTLIGHNSHVTSVAWLPDRDDRLVSGSWDETIKLWDVTNGLPLYTFTGHNAKVCKGVGRCMGSRDGLVGCGEAVLGTGVTWGCSLAPAILSHGQHVC